MRARRTDGELLRDCQRGRRRAWEELYQRFAGLVRGRLAWRGWGFPEGDTEDLVQEVFVTLTSRVPDFDGRCSATTFVLTVTKQVAIDALRRRTALKRGGPQDPGGGTDGGEAVEHVPDEGPGPEETAVRRELLSAVYRVLAGADDRCRRVLVAFYFEQRRYREIGESMGVGVNTVASWLARCLERMRRGVLMRYGTEAVEDVIQGAPQTRRGSGTGWPT